MILEKKRYNHGKDRRQNRTVTKGKRHTHNNENKSQ